MSKPRVGARIQKWRGDWYLFYRDEAAGGIERRRKCTGLEATNASSRRKLVQEYQLKEQLTRAERTRRGGTLAFDTSLLEALQAYVADIDEREKVRRQNPDAREGLTKDSAKQMRYSVNRFVNWLRTKEMANLTTGELDASTIRRFFDSLAAEETKHGNRRVMRRAATMNKHKRHIRAALNHINNLRPPRFPDFLPFVAATKQKAGDTHPPRSFTSRQLANFLKTAIEFEGENHGALFLGRRAGEPPTAVPRHITDPQTPVSAIFLLLALTGCRLEEALRLKWNQVEVEEGVLRFQRTKTGPYRHVRLLDAPEAVIAPEFCRLLFVWWKLAKDSPTKAEGYVLPHGTHPRPYRSRSEWTLVDDQAGLHRIGPQALRQNFVSYGASLKVPASVVAMWAGHGANVAEKHYRATVRHRVHTDTFEGAMGLSPIIRDLIQSIGDCTGVRPPGIR